jgi:hypothetical protein
MNCTFNATAAALEEFRRLRACCMARETLNRMAAAEVARGGNVVPGPKLPAAAYQEKADAWRCVAREIQAAMDRVESHAQREREGGGQ